MPDYPDGDASSFAGRTAGGTGGGEGGGKQEIDVFLARSGGNDFRRAGRSSGAIDNDRKIARGARGRENERRLSTDSPWSSHGCQESRGESDKSVTPLGRQTRGGGDNCRVQLPRSGAEIGAREAEPAASKRLSRSPMTTSVPPPRPPARRIPLPSPRGFSL